MKRIIDGATYNTDTATLIASGHTDNSPEAIDTSLYQNRAGVYFAVDVVTVSYRDRRGETKERVDYEWEVIGDAAKARTYCEKYDLNIERDIEDMPPEATPGEKMATVYLRVTPTLKANLDEVATEDRLSGNLWATRCLERCLNYREGQGLKELAELAAISSSFAPHRDGEWSRDLCIEALSDINDLASNLADTLLGREDAMTDLMLNHVSDIDIQHVQEKFRPYKG